VPLLCDAVRESALEMSARASQVNGALQEIKAAIAEAGDRLLAFQRFLGQWRILVMRRRAQHMLGDLLGTIDQEFSAFSRAMDMLRTLEEEFERSMVPFEVDELEAQVARIRSESRDYSDVA